MSINSFPIPTRTLDVSTLARTSELRQNQKIIRSLADLPTPVGDIITIPDDTMLAPDGMVDITPNALSLGSNCSIIGVDPGRDIIMTSRAGLPTIISNGALGQRIFRQFAVVNNGGSAFEVSTTQDIHSNFFWVGVLGATSFGDVSGGRVIAIKSCYQGEMTIPGVGTYAPTDGVNIGGTIAKLLVSDTPFEDMDTGFTAINLNNTLNAGAVDIRGNYFKGTGGDAAVLQDPSAFVGRGIFSANVITNGVTSTVGFDGTTPEWDFSDNSGIRNSATAGSLSMDGNTTATVVSAVNTWVKVAGITQSAFLERFIEDQNNRLTHVGVRDVDAMIASSLTVEGSVNNQTIEFAIFVNGVQTTPAMKTVLGGPGAINVAAITTLAVLSPNDYLELWGRCTSGADNFTVQSLQLVAKG